MDKSTHFGALVVALMLMGCGGETDDSSVGGGAAGGGADGGAAAAGPAEISAGDGKVALSADNATIGFVGTKPDGTRQPGGFGEFTGEIEVDTANNAVKSISVEIQTDSIWSNAGKRLTDHLKSPDFFNSREQPTATFKSTNIETVDADAGDYKVSGELTMLGNTAAVEFPAKISMADGKFSLDSEFKLDRTKFGMTYGEGNIHPDVEMTLKVGEDAATTVPEIDETADAGGQRGGRGRRGGRGNFDPAAMMERMDADGDGKLSGDEIPEPMRERATDADTDGDGALSLEELQAMRPPGGRGRGGQGGGGGANNEDN